MSATSLESTGTTLTALTRTSTLTTTALHATASATATKAGTNLIFSEFSVLVLVEGLQRGSRIFDFRGGNLAVLVCIERGKHGQEAHHTGTSATWTTSATTAFGATGTARATGTALTTTAALATLTAFAEALGLSVCHHEEAAEREYE